MAVTLFGCGGGGGQSSSPAQPTAKVSLSPTSETVSQGATFTRTIELRDMKNTFYAAFDLSYDPNVIQYVNATEGTFLNRNGSDPTSFQTSLQNGVEGRITVGLTRLGQIGEVSGSGTLLTLTFKAVSPGTTTIAFADSKGFKNMGNQDIVIDAWENGTVTVQ